MVPPGTLDIHAHFFPPQTSSEAAAVGDALRAVCFMVPGSVTWDPESTLAYNDSAGVQMQMLSYLPKSLPALRAANDYGSSLVQQHPSRFGLLAALPTDNPTACLEEIKRTTSDYAIPPDGFATLTMYNEVGLGDSSLEHVWKELNSRKAVVHIHPNAFAPAAQGRPAPLIEVAFDTTRTVVDMLYAAVFRRYPDITFVLGHCGAALPVLSGRLSLLGTEPWIPNSNMITRQEVEEQLGRLWVDTAATARTGLLPAVKMVGVERVVYGADCGVPCSTRETMEENRRDVLEFEKENNLRTGTILENGWNLFPKAAERVEKEQKGKMVNGA